MTDAKKPDPDGIRAAAEEKRTYCTRCGKRTDGPVFCDDCGKQHVQGLKERRAKEKDKRIHTVAEEIVKGVSCMNAMRLKTHDEKVEVIVSFIEQAIRREVERERERCVAEVTKEVLPTNAHKNIIDRIRQGGR